MFYIAVVGGTAHYIAASDYPVVDVSAFGFAAPEVVAADVVVPYVATDGARELGVAVGDVLQIQFAVNVAAGKGSAVIGFAADLAKAAFEE